MTTRELAYEFVQRLANDGLVPTASMLPLCDEIERRDALPGLPWLPIDYDKPEMMPEHHEAIAIWIAPLRNWRRARWRSRHWLDDSACTWRPDEVSHMMRVEGPR